MNRHGVPEVLIQRVTVTGLPFEAIKIAAAVCSLNGWAFSLLEVNPEVKNESCVIVFVRLFGGPVIDVNFYREGTKWIADRAHVILSFERTDKNLIYAVEENGYSKLPPVLSLIQRGKQLPLGEGRELLREVLGL